MLLILWGLLLGGSYWWRGRRVTTAEIEDAKLIGVPLEEQWRLGSEGKKIQLLDAASSSSEGELAEAVEQ